MNESAVCTEIEWLGSVFDLGYVPANADVVNTGLLCILLKSTFPYDQFPVTVSTTCPEVRFPDESGTYNQTSVVITVYKDRPNYVPFQLNLGSTCGKYECTIIYTLEIESEEGTTTCVAPATLKAYNATCDFQKCLTNQTGLVYCNLDKDCVSDICSDNCFQILAKLVMMDQVIDQATALKQWDVVNTLFKTALDMCECGCYGGVTPPPEPANVGFTQHPEIP
jgi:hypothetical protein